MLTAALVFVILAIVFWQLSKFFRRVGRDLEASARNEAYFKSALLDSVQSIDSKLNPEPEPIDLFAEINKVDKELQSVEECRRKDREAVEDLINGTD